MEIRTKNEDNRENPNLVTIKDERGMLTPEIIDKAPYFVLRLLNGAKVVHPNEKTVLIRSCGHEFGISPEAYEVFKMITDRVKKEHMEMMGVNKPFNIEDINTIFYESSRLADMECGIDPRLLRVLFYKADETACWFYRTDQPFRHLRITEDINIHVESSDWLSYDIGSRYDMIVYPRAGHPQTFAILKSLQEAGKLVVYETDDDLFNIPSWNPTFKQHNDTGKIFRKAMMEQADGMIVSTPELTKTVKREEQLYVCQNAIDHRIWPMKPVEQVSIKLSKMKRQKIRVMWAGSTTHSHDIKLVQKAVKRIIKEFPDTVEFVFVGSLPDQFAEARQSGSNIEIGVDPKYARNIIFHPGCHMLNWPELAIGLGCHIGLAPLAQHPFNESKSEIKVLEYWALGMAVMATKIAPYKRAIEDGKNGILVKDDENDWYLKLRELITKHSMRNEMAIGGLKTLEDRYLMKNRVYEYERALLLMARGKVCRRECNEMIEARLKEKGWGEKGT